MIHKNGVFLFCRTTKKNDDDDEKKLKNKNWWIKMINKFYTNLGWLTKQVHK